MNKLIIFQSDEKAIPVSVRLEGDSLWLTQEQMAELFGRERSVITKHLRNIFEKKELEEESNVQFLHIAHSDKPVKFYNLDTIISVGYRVNSKRGTQFRQWATQILHGHLTKGWTLDQARFEQNSAELETALLLVKKVALSDDFTSEMGRGLLDIISRYTQTFLLLQRYDEGLLTEPKGTPGGNLPTVIEAKMAIAQLKKELISRGEASQLFGQERTEGLSSILNNLDQTVFGKPAYETIENKAAHLLYFVIKNHPLSDGNKRVGAFLFIDFLHRNHALLKNGQPIINDIGLTALALLVAESIPNQKETIINLIKNMLVRL